MAVPFITQPDIQRRTMGNVQNIGTGLGGAMSQRWAYGQQDDAQRLASAAKKEGTETRVNTWFSKAVYLSPEERLKQIELDPSIKNWSAAYAYAKYLAQNMPVEQLGTATQQLRGMPGGPGALAGFTDILGGKGAGIPPQQAVTAQRGLPFVQPALKRMEAQFGAPGRAAGMEQFGGVERMPKPWERVLFGEAREAKQAVPAEKWWQETRPNLMIKMAREEAFRNAEIELGEHGSAWIRAKMNKLETPEWIEGMSDEQKEGLGLYKLKTGGYGIKEVPNLSPSIQETYLDLMRMEPPKLEDFSATERNQIMTVVQGRRALAVGREVDQPEWVRPYIDKPLAMMTPEERTIHIVALLSVMPLPQIRMIIDLIERPTVQKIVGIAEKQRKQKPGLFDWLK